MFNVSVLVAKAATGRRRVGDDVSIMNGVAPIGDGAISFENDSIICGRLWVSKISTVDVVATRVTKLKQFQTEHSITDIL